MPLQSAHRTAVVLVMVLALLAPAAATAGAQETPEDGTKKEAAGLPFAGRVEKMKKKYDPVEPPAKPPRFRWDFSRKRTLRYRYDQQVRSSFGAPGGSGPGQQAVDIRGDMLVKSKGDGTAKLVLQNMTARMGAPGQDGEGAKKRRKPIPTKVVPGLKENGSARYGSHRLQAMLRLLFALPSEPLQVGESVRKPVSMPFNAMGSPLQVKGHMKLKLARYVCIDGRRCAQLNARYDISKLDVPKEMTGSYEASLRGMGVYFFCPEEGKFTAGGTAAVMEMGIKPPEPGKGGGGAQGAAPPAAPMSMKMQTFLTFGPAAPQKKEKGSKGEKPRTQKKPGDDHGDSARQVLKSFFRAWAGGNREKARRLMLPGKNSELLWDVAERWSVRKKRRMRSRVAEMSFERLQPGDRVGPDTRVRKDMVGPDRIVLRPVVQGKKWPLAIPVLRRGGRWQVDPAPVIEQTRKRRNRSQQKERTPRIEVQTALSTLRTAQRAYKAANGRYARSLKKLADEGYLSPDDFEDMKFVQWSQLGADGAGGGNGIAQWKGSIEGYGWSSRYITVRGKFGGSKK